MVPPVVLGRMINVHTCPKHGARELHIPNEV